MLISLFLDIKLRILEKKSNNDFIDSSKKVEEGDIIWEINGINTRNLTLNEGLFLYLQISQNQSINF